MPQNKNVVYTAIFGDYEGLVPQRPQTGFDYVCFTDNPNLKAKPWNINVCTPPVKNDPTRANRHVKILVHQYLWEYENSVFIDGNFLIIGDMSKLIEKYLANQSMAAFSHTETSDPRDCLYSEYEALIKIGEKTGNYRDDPEIMAAQIKRYREEGYPQHRGLIKGGVLLRKHSSAKMIQVMEDWWKEIEKGSKRDQLSFNYAAWKNDFTYETIPGDIRRGNPYAYWLGKHRKNWSLKILKTRLKLFVNPIKKAN
ncbi:MAG: glycosyltransferase domain-containing protein [Leeuwenhoekiella sp.]